jgi:hypothetical protein
LAAKNGVYNQVNAGGLANESIFAIILQTFKELTNTNTLINSSGSLADWTRMSSPTSPYVFKDATPENINLIKKQLKDAPYAMFLRKVDREFPDAVLKELMDTDFGHMYPVLHNQAKTRTALISSGNGKDTSASTTSSLTSSSLTSFQHFLDLKGQHQYVINTLLMTCVITFACCFCVVLG